MSQSHLCTIAEPGVAWLTLNRPDKRNALTRGLLTDLLIAVRKLSANQDVRVIVLKAAGPVFCAGMDLAEMQEVAESPDAEAFWQQDAQVFCDLLAAIVTAPKPVVAVLQGPVLAGGVGLVLACDLVLAAEEAYLSLPEPRRGIVASIVTPLLTYRTAAGGASSLLLSGERVAAAQAYGWGLCHDIIPDDRLNERTEELIANVLNGSPQALAETERRLLRSAGGDIVAALEAAVDASAEARKTDDAREGLAAFLEKRPPSWQPEET